MFNSLWSRPKKLALNSKSRICRISEKMTTWWDIPNFLEISVTFDFHPGISRTFGWTVRFSKFQQFPDFLEIFLRKFPYHDDGNLGGMESAQGQPCEVIQIFVNFLLGIIVIKLNFLLRGILVWMVRFADFVFLPDFLENVHSKFHYHLSPFLNFRNLRLDEKLS